MAHKEKSEKTGKNGRTKAVAYLRTSSAANVGADKDSEKRQRQQSRLMRRLAALRSPQKIVFMIRP